MAREMKDSGIEWIGEIPREWEIGRIGQLYTERKEKVSDKDYAPLSVTMKGIVPQLSTAAKTDAHDDRKLVIKGDFAINSRSDRRGSCGISKYDGSVSLINIILSPKNEMNPIYYEWLFHSTMFSDEFYKWGHGIVNDLWTTNWQDMKKITVPIPSKEEQEQIANFLDAQCAHIDSVIEKTRAAVEEYKKLKQAVITQAVTKGIRPNREMKDSGIEWFPVIPMEWTVSRVGLHYDIILGKMLCQNQLNSDYTLEPYYCAANVHFDGVSNEDLKQMWFSAAEKEQYLVNEGDLLVVEGGAGAGGSAIVISVDKPTYIQNSVMIVRPKNTSNNCYLRYLLEFLVKEGYIEVACNKATIPHFTKDKLANVPYLVSNEQSQIVAYLDEKTAAIDSIIKKKEQLIVELEAYKKSLIYEYVTGKKEVPHSKPKIKYTIEFKMALLMCRILQYTNIEGRVHMQKVIYSSDTLLNLFNEIQYYRFQKGPYDINIERYEHSLVQHGWVKVYKKKGKVIYKKTSDFNKYTSFYKNVFSEMDLEIKRICQLFNVLSTAQAGKTATVVASWNDFLIDGVTPTDEMIVNDIVTNWTANKANIPRKTWFDTLEQIKSKGLVPKGFGKKTLHLEEAKHAH